MIEKQKVASSDRAPAFDWTQVTALATAAFLFAGCGREGATHDSRNAGSAPEPRNGSEASGSALRGTGIAPESMKIVVKRNEYYRWVEGNFITVDGRIFNFPDDWSTEQAFNSGYAELKGGAVRMSIAPTSQAHRPPSKPGSVMISENGNFNPRTGETRYSDGSVWYDVELNVSRKLRVNETLLPGRRVIRAEFLFNNFSVATARLLEGTLSGPDAEVSQQRRRFFAILLESESINALEQEKGPLFKLGQSRARGAVAR